MSTQRAEHWQRYILPHVEQYTEGKPFLEGFRDGATGDVDLSGLAQAWFWGSVKTLFSPSVPALLDLAKIERPHFYYTEGITDLDRAQKMVRDSGWIGAIYVINVVILCFFYIYCIIGISRTGRIGIIMGMICAAAILSTGPVGYAKYRLIIEPSLCFLAGKGLTLTFE